MTDRSVALSETREKSLAAKIETQVSIQQKLLETGEETAKYDIASQTYLRDLEQYATGDINWAALFIFAVILSCQCLKYIL